MAALTVMLKVISLMLDLNRHQSQDRHSLRNELATLLVAMEDRVTRRLETLEKHSAGYRRFRRDNPETDQDG